MKRLFLTISIGILLAIIVSTFLTGEVMRRTFDRQFKKGMRGGPYERGPHITEVLNGAPEEELAAAVARLKGESKAPLTLTKPNDPKLPADLSSRLRFEQHAFYFSEEGRTDYISVHGGKYIAVSGPTLPPSHFSWLNLLLMLGITLPIVGLTGFLLTYPVVKRLRALESAAVKIGNGHFDARADVTSTDAVGNLAGRFNEMADKVQALLENQRHLIQAVSHELRTPISRIRFNLEILSESANAEDRANRIRTIDNELNELSELVGELLTYVGLESKQAPMQCRDLDLPMILAEIAEQFGEQKPDLLIKIHDGESDNPLLWANEKYFRRAMKNLVSNAVRYAKSTVTIAYREMGECVIVNVADDGPGIAPRDRDKVFEPFIRLDESRSRESGGAGLGLAIVKRIVEAHGGTASIEENESGGAVLITSWPKDNPA